MPAPQVDVYTPLRIPPHHPSPAPDDGRPPPLRHDHRPLGEPPDLRRWGDPATREAEYGELLSLAGDACRQRASQCDVVHAWEKVFETKPIPLKRRGAKAAEPAPLSAPETPVAPTSAPAEDDTPITGEERDRLVKALQLGAALTFTKLSQMWGGSRTASTASSTSSWPPATWPSQAKARASATC